MSIYFIVVDASYEACHRMMRLAAAVDGHLSVWAAWHSVHTCLVLALPAGRKWRKLEVSDCTCWAPLTGGRCDVTHVRGTIASPIKPANHATVWGDWWQMSLRATINLASVCSLFLSFHLSFARTLLSRWECDSISPSSMHALHLLIIVVTVVALIPFLHLCSYRESWIYYS